MIFFAKICALLSILYLVKAFLYPIFKPVSARQKKRTRKYMKEKQSNALKQKMYILKKKFAIQYIKNLMSSAERLRYKKMIDRLDLSIKPEEILVDQMIYTD